ncbi:hypothetical protein JCM10207_008617 [Rhodosporidiobolus poonsookiae]
MASLALLQRLYDVLGAIQFLLHPAEPDLYPRWTLPVASTVLEQLYWRSLCYEQRENIHSVTPDHLCEALHLPSYPIFTQSLKDAAEANPRMTDYCTAAVRSGNEIIYTFHTSAPDRAAINHWIASMLEHFPPRYIGHLSTEQGEELVLAVRKMCEEVFAVCRRGGVDPAPALRVLKDPSVLHRELHLPGPFSPLSFAAPPLHPHFEDGALALRTRPVHLLEYTPPAAHSLGMVHKGMMRDRMAQRYGFASAAEWARRW